MYKAVISDLDGTLLNSKHELSDYTKRVVERISKKGTKFFIATGRHHLDASHIRKSLGLDTILISSNGARVHGGDGRVLYSKNIPSDIVSELLNWKYDDEIHANVYQEDKWFVELENKFIEEFRNESGFFYELTNFKSLSHDGVSKMCFISHNAEKLVELQKRLEGEYVSRLNITYSLSNCLEIMAKEVSKGEALIRILKQHEISPEECIAFGDGLNDYEMLSLVGKGVLMANASPILKSRLSKCECTLSNDEDGVARYLEKIL